MVVEAGLYAVKKVRQQTEKAAKQAKDIVKQTTEEGKKEAASAIEGASGKDTGKQIDSRAEGAAKQVEKKTAKTIEQLQDQGAKVAKHAVKTATKPVVEPIKKTMEIKAPITTYMMEKTKQSLGKAADGAKEARKNALNKDSNNER